ncbi:hypothetical protein [Metarhizobium album]|uniref:hypothetical protein n=1 Tax=Metarhizobium album TaxID=2182425 RepID=UPI000FFE409F|nr:hypothetical protein [Rhizobium album]
MDRHSQEGKVAKRKIFWRAATWDLSQPAEISVRGGVVAILLRSAISYPKRHDVVPRPVALLDLALHDPDFRQCMGQRSDQFLTFRLFRRNLQRGLYVTVGKDALSHNHRESPPAADVTASARQLQAKVAEGPFCEGPGLIKL